MRRCAYRRTVSRIFENPSPVDITYRRVDSVFTRKSKLRTVPTLRIFHFHLGKRWKREEARFAPASSTRRRAAAFFFHPGRLFADFGGLRSRPAIAIARCLRVLYSSTCHVYLASSQSRPAWARLFFPSSSLAPHHRAANA